MFTYRFVGLNAEDASTRHYYGSLPAKAEVGHVLTFEESGNGYRVVRMMGNGLEGDDARNDQATLAFAEMVERKSVPILWLRKLDPKTIGAKGIRVTGRSFTAAEVKEFSRKNRKTRLKS